MTTASPTLRKAIAATALAAALFIAAAPAPAQTEPATARPARIETPGPTRMWLAMMIAIGAGAMAVGAAVMPSQRTHQD
jgi:hypothetical protein